MTQAVWNVQATMQNPASYISASKLPAIEAAALARCDDMDGVKDGVIDDPTRCHFDPSALQSGGRHRDKSGGPSTKSLHASATDEQLAQDA